MNLTFFFESLEIILFLGKYKDNQCKPRLLTYWGLDLQWGSHSATQHAEDMFPQTITDPHSTCHSEGHKGKKKFLRGTLSRNNTSFPAVFAEVDFWRSSFCCSLYKRRRQLSSFISSGDPLMTWTSSSLPSDNKYSGSRWSSSWNFCSHLRLLKAPLHICMTFHMASPSDILRSSSTHLAVSSPCLSVFIESKLFFTWARKHHQTLSPTSNS